MLVVIIAVSTICYKNYSKMVLLFLTAQFLQCFSYFAALKIHFASKNLEQTTYTNKLKKNYANGKASPQGYLIITK